MSGYSWFRFDVDAGDHPKFSQLDDELGERNTIGYAARAWCWLMRYAARGVWAPEFDPAIEDACDWRGERGQLIAAFRKVGLVEDLDDGRREWHDWWEKQGKAVEKAEKDARVKRENRAKKAREQRGQPPEKPPKNGAKTARAGRADGAQTAPARNETRRDETEQSSSYEDDGEAPTPPSPQPSPVSQARPFFDWFQDRRHDDGFVREQPPDDLEDWFKEAVEELGDPPEGSTAIDGLQVAARGYRRDQFWLLRSLPWAGFAEQWSRHVRSVRGTQATMPLGVLGGVS